jgi:hypothetical protein
MLSWNTVEITVSEFYGMLSEISTKRIDCDPVGQRPDVESLDKKQGIIETVLLGFDFGELKLRTLEGDKEFLYRSIDGGHRKRAVRDFISNKFKTNKNTYAFVNGTMVYVGNMLYRDLPQEVKESLGDYKMRFTIYGSNMTDEQAGETFRRTNITTDVNHQEMLNSYENNVVAKHIRELCRPIRGLNNDYHPLFEYRVLGDDRKQTYFNKPSTRLRDDEFATRLLTVLVKDTKDANWMTCGNKETEKMWVNLGSPTEGEWVKNPALAKKHKRILDEALGFLQCYAVSKKNNGKGLLTTQEVTMVSRLYTYLVRTYGQDGFKVNNFDQFYHSVRNAMDRFVGRDERNLRTDLHTDSKGIRTVTECFKQYLTVHDDPVRCEQSVKWLLEEMDLSKATLIDLDKERCFSGDLIEQVWRQQGMVCWVTGLPLKLADAAGGHIISHADGGRTIPENCMVCSKSENTRMGSMDATMYRKMRLKELNLAA